MVSYISFTSLYSKNMRPKALPIFVVPKKRNATHACWELH
ncbi:unnamed protein product [Brassica oleracea]